VVIVNVTIQAAHLGAYIIVALGLTDEGVICIVCTCDDMYLSCRGEEAPEPAHWLSFYQRRKVDQHLTYRNLLYANNFISGGCASRTASLVSYVIRLVVTGLNFQNAT
jgi:hypothetical protein